jgi:hypothetical protein
MAKLIGVYKAKGGAVAMFLAAARRWLGLYSCDLSRVTHQAGGEKPSWREFQERIARDGGHTHICVFPQTASAAYVQASAGREPCVLIEDDEGHLSMILDWNDLALAKGSVARYEDILRSKLLMY